MSKATKIVVAALATAGTALAAGATAQADTILTLPDYCKTAPPHATLKLGALPKTATSNGAAYYYVPSAGCSRFIVDVDVAPMAGAPFHIVSSYAGPSTGPLGISPESIALSQADCSLYRQYVSLYKKPWFTLAPPAKFTKLTTGVLRGTWKPAVAPPFGGPAHCELTLASGQMPPGFLTAGSSLLSGATYRMTVGVKTSDWQKVRVRAAILPPPPG